MATPHREGQFFLLPVERGVYAVGLIARAPPRGNVLLGYFFGPRRRTPPVVEWLRSVHANQAAFVCRFKDTALIRGEWQKLDVMEGFQRLDWPVPAFHRFEGSVTHVPGNDTASDWRVEYGDDNLIVPTAERPAAAADFKLCDDIAFDPRLLADEVGQRVKEMIPSADDPSWR